MNIGDIVTWTSQAMGCKKTKTGKVVAEIPAGNNPRKHIPDDAKKSHIKFDEVSSIDRILIAVPAGKDGNITHYYCPSKSVLESQGN